MSSSSEPPPYAPVEAVVVSAPAKRSEYVDTKVTVEGSYADLMTRIDAQIRNSMTAQSEAARKVIRKEKNDAIQEIMLMKEYERNFCILVWKRVIQDQVYERMAKALHIGDPKVEGYESLVNEYEMRYGKGSLTEEDMQHLRSPPERTKANELVHPKLGDARTCYQSLSRRLREDQDDEEMMRYGRYYELGTGDTTNYESTTTTTTTTNRLPVLRLIRKVLLLIEKVLLQMKLWMFRRIIRVHR